MAQAITIPYSKFRILLGNAASPEVFAAPCGLNTRALRRSKTTNEIDIPDCDDEDAPAWVGREVRSLDWSVTGEGVLAEQAVEDWEAFFNSTDSRNVRIEMVFPSTVSGSPGTIAKVGRAHLTSFEVTGNRGEKVTVSIELSGDGALVTA